MVLTLLGVQVIPNVRRSTKYHDVPVQRSKKYHDESKMPCMTSTTCFSKILLPLAQERSVQVGERTTIIYTDIGCADPTGPTCYAVSAVYQSFVLLGSGVGDNSDSTDGIEQFFEGSNTRLRASATTLPTPGTCSKKRGSYAASAYNMDISRPMMLQGPVILSLAPKVNAAMLSLLTVTVALRSAQ